MKLNYNMYKKTRIDIYGAYTNFTKPKFEYCGFICMLKNVKRIFE